MDDITILLEQIQEHLLISNLPEDKFDIIRDKLEEILIEIQE